MTEAIMVRWGGLMVMVKRFEVQFAPLLTTRQAWKQVFEKKKGISLVNFNSRNALILFLKVQMPLSPYCIHFSQSDLSSFLFSCLGS